MKPYLPAAIILMIAVVVSCKMHNRDVMLQGLNQMLSLSDFYAKEIIFYMGMLLPFLFRRLCAAYHV